MTVPIPECLGITEEDVREALKLIVVLQLAALKRGIPAIATRVALKVALKIDDECASHYLTEEQELAIEWLADHLVERARRWVHDAREG